MAKRFWAKECVAKMKDIKIKKSTLYLIGIIAVIAFGGILLFSNSTKALSELSKENNEIQEVKLSTNGGNYVLEPAELKKDVLVRLEADLSKMPGCSRSIVIPAFDVSKTFSTNDNKVEFIPNKAGTFNIACSMNMYKGIFTVLESDGAKSDYIEKKTATESSCSGNSGGCGCGGLI